MGRNKRKATIDSQDNVTESSNPDGESIKNVQTSPKALPSRKKVVAMTKFVRRSGRLMNLQTRKANEEMSVEEIDLDDNEQEEQPLVEKKHSEPPPANLERPESKIVGFEQEETPLDEQQNSEPNPTAIARMERKIDFLVQSVEEFQSQGAFSSTASHVEVKYRSLYNLSQKKVEELTKENKELSERLELAAQKIKLFEQNIEHMKDMTIMSLASQLVTSKAEGATTRNAPESVAADENDNVAPSPRKKYPKRKK